MPWLAIVYTATRLPLELLGKFERFVDEQENPSAARRQLGEGQHAGVDRYLEVQVHGKHRTTLVPTQPEVVKGIGLRVVSHERRLEHAEGEAELRICVVHVYVSVHVRVARYGDSDGGVESRPRRWIGAQLAAPQLLGRELGSQFGARECM